MSEKLSSKRKKIMGLITFVIIVILAFFGGKSIGKAIGKNFAEHQNTAQSAQEQNA